MASSSPDDARGHWAKLFEGLQVSTLDFYTQVEAQVAQRSIPDTTIERIEYRQGGVLSDVRQYLRVRRRREVFDICGAPFGGGFFFSWWLAELRPTLPTAASVGIVFGYLFIIGFMMQKSGIFVGPLQIIFLLGLMLFILSRLGSEDADDFILMLPFLGPLYRRFFRPITYYRIDTSEMFQQAVESAFQDAVKQISECKGFRIPPDLDWKPVMRNFFKR